MRLQRSPAGQRHCSHAHLGEALVTRGEATVTSRRWDPPIGGPQQPAEKPVNTDTDGLDPRPAGLPLYPWGVGLYKPPRAPMQRVGTN